jgi:hypothetical protein
MANKNFRYTYKPEIKFMIEGKDPIVPFNIQRIHRESRYFSNFYSIMEVELTVHSQYLETLFKNQHKVYCSFQLTLQKYSTDSQKDEFKEINMDEEKILFNEIFIPFFYKSSFSSLLNDEDMDIEAGMDDKGNTSNPIASFTKIVRFTLYSLSGLTANKALINAVLSNGEDGVDPGTAIRYILENSPFKSVIVDMPDNELKYKELVLPPHNIAMSFYDLQVRYGVYGAGLLAFFEPPTLYILNKYNTNHDFIAGETHKSIINIIKDIRGGILGYVEELANKDLQYTIQSFPERNMNDVYEAELYGNVLLFTNYSQSARMLSYSEGEFESFEKPTSSIGIPSEKHTKTGDKIVVEYDELNNPYNMASVARAMAPHIPIRINIIENASYESFKPNSIFELNMVENPDENAKFGGVYSLMACDLDLTRSTPDGSVFMCIASNIILIKD